MALLRSTKVLKTMTPSHAVLYSELALLRAARQPCQGSTLDFVGRACTRYNGLVCTHVASYRNLLNAFLADAQSTVEYVNGYHNYVWEGRCSLLIDEATSDEAQCGCRSLQNEGGDTI